MNVINDYYLLKPNGDQLRRLKECDFNLPGNKNRNIPLSLKNTKDPLLILFYYNRTDIDILKRWEEVGKENIRTDKIKIGSNEENIGRGSNEENIGRGSNEEDTGRGSNEENRGIGSNEENRGIGSNEEKEININAGFVNLDYEKDIYNYFVNIPYSNPFRWATINPEDKNYFIIFYYNSYPQYYYKGFINRFLISEEFKDWSKKLNDSEDEKGTKFKKIGNKYIGDDSYYRVKIKRPLLDKNDEIFEINKGDIYKIITDNQDNYQLIDFESKKVNNVVFVGKIYEFETIFQRVEPDKSNKRKKKEIILEPDMFSLNFAEKEKAEALRDLYSTLSGRSSDSFDFTN